jgi:PAS domain S-box-containing protein
MDIPSHNLAEEALQLALDSAGAGTWDWNLQTGELVWSKQCLAMFGLPADTQMSYEKFLQVVHPEDRERIDRAVKIALQQRTEYAVDMRAIWPDGSVHWVASRGRAYFDESGQPVRMVGAGLDVTQLKTTEESLRASREELRLVKERFELALQNSPITVFTTDRDLRYKWVYNPRGGHNVEQLLGKRDSEVLERADEAAWIEKIKSQVLRTGVCYRGEMTAHIKGEPRTYHVSIEPARDAQCHIIGLTCTCFDLTEEKRAEAELQRLARQRQLALDAAEVGWWHYDPVTGISTWDERFGKIFGVTGNSGEAEKIVGLLHPDDQIRAWANLRESMNIIHPEPHTTEYRVLRPDGLWRWVEARGAAEFEGDGEQRRVISVAGTVRDVTEQKLADETLRQQRERYDFVADGSDVGFWFCDLPFNKLIWDKRVKNHFWLEAEVDPVTIEMFYARLHPDDRARTRLAMEVAISSHSQYDVEYRTIAPDGRQKWIRAIGRAFYDQTGKALRFDGVTQDITERKCTEEALRASEARYRLLFETMTEGFVLCEIVRDDAGRAIDIRWLACNPALERLTGLSRDRVIGHCASEIFPDEYEWWVGTYDEVVRNKRVHRFEQGAHSIGKFWDLTAFPYEGDRFAVLYDDITARKQAENAVRASEARYRELAENLDRQVQARTRELQQKNEQMLRAADDLRELSGRVLRVQDEERRRIARELHDSAGQILTALGLELGSLEEDVQKAAPHLAGGIAGAQELVQQLHREIRTTSYLLHPPLLDETGLSSALSWYFEGLGQRSGIEIHFDMPEDFGRLPRDMELVMFRLVQESMTNIHRHSGSPTAHIRIARDSGAVTIEVQDHGKGMSPEQLKKIREGGSGVGIRGMRERLRQFRGELKIESNGSGTQVRVKIPLPRSAAFEVEGEPLQPAV